MMKTYLLLLCVVIVSAKYLSETDSRSQFNRWTHRNGKDYTSEELVHRYQTFRENVDRVIEHNRNTTSYYLGVNRFADLTFSEFQAIYLRPSSDTRIPLPPKHFPAVVMVDINTIDFQLYFGGIFNISSLGNHPNYGLLITELRFGETEIPFYRAKTSFGSEWGEDGDIRIVW